LKSPELGRWCRKSQGKVLIFVSYGPEEKKQIRAVLWVQESLGLSQKDAQSSNKCRRRIKGATG